MNKEEQFDFYWKEIFTGLAYNPIEFNTYRFDQSMSLPGKLNKLYDMFKQLALNNQEVMDYLKEFVETFDVKLYKTVTDVLEVWLTDGRLADIMLQINGKIIEFESIYNQRLNEVETTYNQRLNEVETTTRKNVFTLNPDNISTDLVEDNTEIFLQENIVLTEPIIIKNLNNIYFNAPITIKIAPNFNVEHNYFIKFENCSNVRINISLLDGDNVSIYPSGGDMNFPILFEDCMFVVVENVRAENCMKIGGLSSTINAVSKKKVGNYFTVKNLYVENCRSAVFTQYANNTIENVVAINTNDAIIALNSENCKNSYINNCYANYNNAFPLVAVENMATEVIVENCIAKNTRGLFELFSLDIPIVNAQPKSYTNLIVRNSSHIIDDCNFIYHPTVFLQTISLRRSIEKYHTVILENVELINLTTNKKCSYLYLSATNIMNEHLNYLKITNPKMITNSSSDFGMLIDDNIDNVIIDDMYFKALGTKIGFAIRHLNQIQIKNMRVSNGYVENFERFISNDLLDNQNVYRMFRLENLRTENVDVLLYNTPNGNISLVSYIKEIFNNYDYVLTNSGSSVVRYIADNVPPSMGKNFEGDIAYNLHNDLQYYYDGSKWIRSNINGAEVLNGLGVPTFTPDTIGDIFISTNTQKIYFSVGTNSVSDWVLGN